MNSVRIHTYIESRGRGVLSGGADEDEQIGDLSAVTSHLPLALASRGMRGVHQIGHYDDLATGSCVRKHLERWAECVEAAEIVVPQEDGSRWNLNGLHARGKRLDRAEGLSGAAETYSALDGGSNRSERRGQPVFADKLGFDADRFISVANLEAKSAGPNG